MFLDEECLLTTSICLYEPLFQVKRNISGRIWAAKMLTPPKTLNQVRDHIIFYPHVFDSSQQKVHVKSNTTSYFLTSHVFCRQRNLFLRSRAERFWEARWGWHRAQKRASLYRIQSILKTERNWNRNAILHFLSCGWQKMNAISSAIILLSLRVVIDQHSCLTICYMHICFR